MCNCAWCDILSSLAYVVLCLSEFNQNEHLDSLFSSLGLTKVSPSVHFRMSGIRIFGVRVRVNEDGDTVRKFRKWLAFSRPLIYKMNSRARVHLYIRGLEIGRVVMSVV